MNRDRTHRGFSLVEALVALAVLAVVMGALAPSLSAMRGSARGAACASNLRQCWVPMFEFAEANGGLGPAIGQPYGRVPQWPLVVLAGTSRGLGAGEGVTSLYREGSVLVCPSETTRSHVSMTRTYAMNAAGHNRAAWNEDPDRFDAALLPGERHVGIRFDRVARASLAMLLVDSSVAPVGTGNPPETQTHGVIDLRGGAGQESRLAKRHVRGAVNALMVDGSVSGRGDVPEWFREALP